jgi:hypothetical protein
MIEPLIPPQSLDNDIAVVRILQLMGQLSPNDIKYIFQVAERVSRMICVEDQDELCTVL